MSDPMKQQFPGQRNDEHVITFLRRHWITAVGSIFQLIGFNLLPVGVLAFFLYGIGWNPPTEGFWYVLVVMITALYYIGTWLAFYHTFVDYHLDVWVLTDQRIINIEQQGLFDRTISELNLSKVQDVTSEVHGHIQTIFDFGNVYIQTAAEQQRFAFLQVPNPEEVARLVVRANDAAVKRESLYAVHANAAEEQEKAERAAKEHSTNHSSNEHTSAQ